MHLYCTTHSKEITGSDDIALGHFYDRLYVPSRGGKISRDLQNPRKIWNYKGFGMQDTHLSVMVVMVPLYVISSVCRARIGSEFAGSQHYLMCDSTSNQFVVGVYILLSSSFAFGGVPAFRGISMKLVRMLLALDCPVLFPYAPNAVIVVFISTTIGSVILCLYYTIWSYVILPGMLTNFRRRNCWYFWNATGGRKEPLLVIFPVSSITLLPALLVSIYPNGICEYYSNWYSSSSLDLCMDSYTIVKKVVVIWFSNF